ncbi:MAG: methyltransferase domain-containing protein [Magnetococcales bacterium]|nr:methyltransferase domain-containing protein [Magnetococcales bacterium]
MRDRTKCQEEWEERYRSGQTGWDRGTASPALLSWLEKGQLQPCRILIPGCGRGHEVTLLAQRGFHVTAVDIAPAAVLSLRTLLARQESNAIVHQADLLTWEPEAPFAAIYEQTSLCALPPEVWTDYAARLWRWLQPGGHLFALFMQTGRAGGPPFHCAIDAMEALFAASHWQWPSQPPMRVDHPNGFYEWGYCLTAMNNVDGAKT